MASHSRRFSPSNAVTRRAERHLQGTDYLVSCVPTGSTESQYSLIWAAEEAGVERFVPSEFGAIYEFEQFWPTTRFTAPGPARKCSYAG